MKSKKIARALCNLPNVGQFKSVNDTDLLRYDECF